MKRRGEKKRTKKRIKKKTKKKQKRENHNSTTDMAMGISLKFTTIEHIHTSNSMKKKKEKERKRKKLFFVQEEWLLFYISLQLGKKNGVVFFSTMKILFIMDNGSLLLIFLNFERKRREKREGKT